MSSHEDALSVCVMWNDKSKQAGRDKLLIMMMMIMISNARCPCAPHSVLCRYDMVMMSFARS